MKQLEVRNHKNAHFTHTQSTIRCFDALNFRPTPSNIDISRNQVHTRTPHTFCLTTTTLTCVFVRKVEARNHKNAHFTHTQSTIGCFDALNFRPTPSNIDISRNQVHTGTPHTFRLTTTTFPCVFVMQQEVRNHKNAHFTHTQSTDRCFDALNFRPTPSNIDISRNQVHTRTPHTFCLSTTTFSCVFVRK